MTQDSDALPHAETLPIDLAAIGQWLAGQGLAGAPDLHAPHLLAGGTQNIVLRFNCGGRDYVLRHPPAKPRPNSNTLISREIRLLGALGGSRVPTPKLIAACLDQHVIGAVFYVMEAVDGFNPTVAMAPSAVADPAVRHRIGLELIDALAALSQVDYLAAGLADFGKLDQFLERQVGRWRAELDSYARFDGWQGPAALGDVDAIGNWLTARCPAHMQPGIIHGDFHIGNGIFAEDGALSALVDWEMATLGDPLVDLGRFLLSWPDTTAQALPYTMRVTPLDGFPSRAELLARYEERTGRDLTDLPWFEVLACYKLGLIFEGSNARAQAGLAEPATGDRLHRAAVALLDRARRIIAEN